MKIAFIHPDLGIGGAERLVVDAATAVQNAGNDVCIITNSYTTQHCFVETKRFDIKTIDIFPRTIFGQAAALCAYIRMCLAAIYIVTAVKPDLVFCDSVSACIIVFRLFRALGLFGAKVIYYCHFPDLMLTDRKTLMKAVYRFVIDTIETWSIKMADVICVNSEFTREIVKETFKGLPNELLVVYPTLNTEFFDKCSAVSIAGIPENVRHLFVSINRFERKKNIELALSGFAHLKQLVDPEVFKQCFLVIAGGYDTNNMENLLYYRELRYYADDLKVPSKQVLFLRSPSDECKIELLRRALAVLYTPSREHFGIVPVEAMYLKSCVIAVNSGGPKESIEDGVTGFLVAPEPEAFGEKMALLVNDGKTAEEMGDAGRLRVLERFSMERFSTRLNEVIEAALAE